ncbi:hypothetical protein M493_07960 [Geobacillus genomosp. 3]|uniref:Uncharacterized protein n=1 Tax=Geobacillus genomosp. 3 TaxID=1921421 RepID=S6A1P0_GEOG3|nr:hypothetical protein M493_07960 [Geobacillus genomosp. 3]
MRRKTVLPPRRAQPAALAVRREKTEADEAASVFASNIQLETAASAPDNTSDGWQPEQRPIPCAGSNDDVHTVDDKRALYATDGYAAQPLPGNDV